MMRILKEHFGLDLEADQVLTIYGQLLSSPIATKRFTYRNLATAGERLRINAFINGKKGFEIERLKDRMKAIAEKMIEEDSAPNLPEGPLNIPGELQSVQHSEAGVVSALDGIY